MPYNNSNGIVNWVQKHELFSILLAAFLLLALSRFSSKTYDDVLDPLYNKHFRKTNIKLEDEKKTHNIGKTFLWHLLQLFILVLLIYIIAEIFLSVDIKKSIMLSAPFKLVNKQTVNGEPLAGNTTELCKKFSSKDSWSSSIIKL